jgi:hypothetical protein
LNAKICTFYTFRIARLMAEQTNTETKLRARIGYLEGKLRKYADLSGENEHWNQKFEDGEGWHIWWICEGQNYH